MIGWLTGSNRQTGQTEGLVLLHTFESNPCYLFFPTREKTSGGVCRLIGSLRQGDTPRHDRQRKEIILQTLAIQDGTRLAPELLYRFDRSHW